MIVFIKMKWVIAGFCLAFFISGCGVPQYRLEGKVAEGVETVVLLDSLALSALDSMAQVYEHSIRDLETREKASLDSLAKGTSALNRPIANAQKQYRDARAKYRDVFGRLRRFQSFGGNPVFSDDDARVSTQKLLAEISDRFYKGRAFSLETEGQIRRYIRQNLVPLERDVNRARSRLTQLQRSQSGKAKGKETVLREYSQKRVALRDTINTQILESLTRHKLAESQRDSLGRYTFEQLSPGAYHLYVPHPLPSGHLVPVKLQEHRFQHLEAQNRRLILLSDSKAE